MVVPKIEQFESSQHYFQTSFHELCHSTGHHDRLNRLKATAYHGDENYSREELTAELGAAMLCNHTGIGTADLTDNSAAYIQSWLKALRNDTNMVLIAAAKAEKAVDYILN